MTASYETLADSFLAAHIATVGKAMSLGEDVAYPILRKHDVSYVLVIFGALIGYSGDDINKFLWMIRIAQGVWPDEVKESSYFTPRGEYKVDDEAPPTMRESMLYKMSYYRCADLFRCISDTHADGVIVGLRFNELYGGQRAQDRVRGQTLPAVGPTIDSLGEPICLMLISFGNPILLLQQTRHSRQRTGL